MTDYTELKILAAAASPGPWLQENDDLYFKDDGYTRHMMTTDSGHDVCDDEDCDDAHRENLKYIAAANPAVVLALIDENEKLKADLREAKDAKLGLSWAIGEIKAENEQAMADLVTFKGGISALGEAAKKLCFNARTSGGTAGADQELMDSCDGVENALSLVGVSRAIDYVEGLKAENESLTAKYEAARDRKSSITALQIENDKLRTVISDISGALEREYWSEYAGLEETRAILDAAMRKIG